jgi:hypothetical protein
MKLRLIRWSFVFVPLAFLRRDRGVQGNAARCGLSVQT